MVRIVVGLTEIVKGPASEPKTTPFASVTAERKTFVVLERLKVAVSEGPFGTVAGVQFAALFQSPLVGLRFHVALPAKAN